MDKPTASKIIRSVLELSHRLDDVDAELRNIGSEDEKQQFLRALGTIMVELNTGLIRPLVRQYPDLDPDRAHDRG